MKAVKILSVAGASVFGGLLAIGMLVDSGRTPEERASYALEKMAKAADGIKGQRIHQNVIFDGYEIVDRSFTYHYTLTHIVNGWYNGDDKARIEKLMHEKVCGDRRLKRLLKADGVIRYAYKGNDGKELFVVAFDDAICGLSS